MVVQFGELDYRGAPNRTARYVMTARKAFARARGEGPRRAHDRVAVHHELERRPLDDHAQAHAVHAGRGRAVRDGARARCRCRRRRGRRAARPATGIVPRLVGGAERRAGRRDRGDVSAPHRRGHRRRPVLLALLRLRQRAVALLRVDQGRRPGARCSASGCSSCCSAFAVLYAAIFLLAPFFFVRREWKVLPAKPLSALYFAALGLGFIFFEITMIQRLVLYLGYPTYSLTVTLASLLVFSGLGALLSQRLAPRAGTVVPVVFVVLCGADRVLRVGSRSAHGRDARPEPRGAGARRAARDRAARAVSRHVHAARPRRRERHVVAPGRVRGVVVGGERVLLRHRLGPHDHPGDVDRVPRRAGHRARRSTASRSSRSSGCAAAPAGSPVDGVADVRRRAVSARSRPRPDARLRRRAEVPDSPAWTTAGRDARWAAAASACPRSSAASCSSSRRSGGGSTPASSTTPGSPTS